jgi:hypothetical protein
MEVLQVANNNIEYINVTDFGAVGDGTSNDTSAINAAIAQAAKLKNTMVWFPPATGYAVKSSIAVPVGIHLNMEAPLIYTGTDENPALVIGSLGIVNENRRFLLNVQRQVVSKWTNENNIGIQLINCNTCSIVVSQASGFTIGIQCIGDRQGFVYNQIELGQILNNKICLDLTNRGQGWCNENLFLNGRFDSYSNVNRGLSRYGIRITSQDKSYKNNNNNVFIKPSFELVSSSAFPGECVPILIEYGVQNLFFSCRHEQSGPHLARVLNESTENVFDIGYSNDSTTNLVADLTAFPTSVLNLRRTNLTNNAHGEIFISAPLHKTACLYDDSGSINVPKVHVGNASNSTVNPALSNIVIGPNYLEVGTNRGLGVFLDTNVSKRFVVKRDIVPGFGGRVAVRCYDSIGNILSNNSYVKGYSYKSPYFSTNYGGCFLTGSDDDSDYYFQVDDTVKKITVLVCGGTKPLQIKSFSISTINGTNCAVWSGYEEIMPGSNIGTTFPKTGTWSRGKIIYNALPDVNRPLGWICIAGGTPGTWKTFGLIS